MQRGSRWSSPACATSVTDTSGDASGSWSERGYPLVTRSVDAARHGSSIPPPRHGPRHGFHQRDRIPRVRPGADPGHSRTEAAGVEADAGGKEGEIRAAVRDAAGDCAEPDP